MRYVRADIAQVNRSEWRGYVGEFNLFFHGTTKALTEAAGREAIEESEGLSDFEIIWSRC